MKSESDSFRFGCFLRELEIFFTQKLESVSEYRLSYAQSHYDERYLLPRVKHLRYEEHFRAETNEILLAGYDPDTQRPLTFCYGEDFSEDPLATKTSYKQWRRKHAKSKK